MIGQPNSPFYLVFSCNKIDNYFISQFPSALNEISFEDDDSSSYLFILPVMI